MIEPPIDPPEPMWEGELDRMCGAQGVSIVVITRDDFMELTRLAALAKDTSLAGTRSYAIERLHMILGRVETVDNVEKCPWDGSVNAVSWVKGVTEWTCPFCGTVHTEED